MATGSVCDSSEGEQGKLFYYPSKPDTSEDSIKPRPFVKWAGGKRQLIPELRKRMPKSFSRYVEPFVGGGALFFDGVFQSAILADYNSELVNLYKVIQNQVEELIDDLSKHIYDSEYYYQVRNVDRSDEYENWTNVAKASRFLYLNRTCFNGLYRVNSKGHFNTPFGRYTNPKILDAPNLRACSKALANTSIHSSHFLDMEDLLEQGDFVYCDPPYVPLTETSNFTAYHDAGFDVDMHIALRDFCKRIAGRGVKVMLSNSAAPFVKELYKDFKVRKVQANRAINSKASKRGKIEEFLITSY